MSLTAYSEPSVLGVSLTRSWMCLDDGGENLGCGELLEDAPVGSQGGSGEQRPDEGGDWYRDNRPPPPQ